MGKATGPGRVGGVQRKEESGSLFDYIMACLRDPRGLAGVGAGGLEGRRVVLQLAVVLVVINYVSATLLLIFTLGFGLDALVGGLFGVVSGAGLLLAETVAFWFVAGVTASKVGFRALLTGLAFVQILAVVVLVMVALVGAVSMLAGLPPATAVSLARFVYSVLILVYSAFFAMGIFDVGCIPSLTLAFVAGLIALFLPAALVDGLKALFGG